MIAEHYFEVKRKEVLTLNSDELTMLYHIQLLSNGNQGGVFIDALDNESVSIFIVTQMIADLLTDGIIGKKVIQGRFMVFISEVGNRYLQGETVTVIRKELVLIEPVKKVHANPNWR